MKTLDEHVLDTLRQWINASAHYIRDELNDRGCDYHVLEAIQSLERLKERGLVKSFLLAKNTIWKLT